MRLLGLALLILIFGCAPHIDLREGAPVKVDLPQAREQCQAQPALDWCHGR